ncbi:MAG TPA: phosphate regulon transcriptional regulator PhoB [Burkholderiales bacterium]|jgi:two-component system phosphate regulon response regulator PhoB|nr:phosphate regulon transcriptional regulator PhoB [Burkholderiales bacterium]
MNATILIVEDDLEVQELIAINLQRAGYQPLRAPSVPKAEALLRETLPDLVLLDWMLPDTPGMTFARRLRNDQRTKDIPIIMLTARTGESDRVAGLEAGVDDYITKPFFPRELLARIRAVMRRCLPQLTGDIVEIAGVKIDPAARRITCGGRDVELGDIEFRMLHFFMTHAERVYSRAQLLDEVWGDRVFVEERTVDVHIRRLRQTLKPTGHEDLLETVRGVGYRFRRNLPEVSPLPRSAAATSNQLVQAS